MIFGGIAEPGEIGAPALAGQIVLRMSFLQRDPVKAILRRIKPGATVGIAAHVQQVFAVQRTGEQSPINQIRRVIDPHAGYLSNVDVALW